jgi:hypothetical protein
MYLHATTETIEHERVSKLGKVHRYHREKTVAVFRCDNCAEIFSRDRAKMSPKRLSNNYFHVCTACDAKRFAQRKGVEQKKIWDMPASSLQNVSKI